MNKANCIYSKKLPLMAQHFIDEAQEHLEQCRIEISLQNSIHVKIYDLKTDNLIFEYNTEDNCERQSFKSLTFYRNGYCYEAETGSDISRLSISKGNDVIGHQILFESQYLEDINYYFDDFERIFYSFLKTTFKPY